MVVKFKKAVIKDFKRFTNLTVQGIPETARLIILVGPNGCGKSSFFDALYTWYKQISQKQSSWDTNYYNKAGSLDQNPGNNKIVIEFHDSTLEQKKKILYVRTAYRNDPEFQTRKLERQGNLLDQVSVQRMIDNDMAVSRNYQRLVSKGLEDLYDKREGDTTFDRYREESIGGIRESLRQMFPHLKLDNLGDPLNVGTFHFTKGESSGFMFKNLSGGEKAAFDLILDFFIVRQDYNNTIFCIDEPESHIHASIQAKLLSILNKLVPENCQLMLATHSIGMIRQALEIREKNPESVIFLNFGDCDFDVPQTIEPMKPDRKFWKKAYDIALGDLAGLVAPKRVVICEGEPKTDQSVRNDSLDARCYARIFEDEFVDTEFISMGSDRQIIDDMRGLAWALPRIINGIEVVRLIDRDDRTDGGINDANEQGIRVLTRRNLESYIFDDEVLQKLAEKCGKDEMINDLLMKKRKILNDTATNREADNLKPVRSEIRLACKNILGLVHSGNSTNEFMIETLAPLIRPGMKVYNVLKKDIFNITNNDPV